MNMTTDENGFRFFATLADCKPEYTPIKCWSLLQFFTLESRKTVLEKGNLIPIGDLKYMVRCKSPERFLVYDYRGYSVDDMFFYYSRHGNTDEAIENLMRYVTDGNVYLLFTGKDVTDTKAMLQRVYKSRYKDEGKLEYKDFIPLLTESIRYEDYQYYCKSHPGFNTVCNLFEQRIDELWDAVYKKNNNDLTQQ